MRARNRNRSYKPLEELFTEMARELGWKLVDVNSAKALDKRRRKRRRK